MQVNMKNWKKKKQYKKNAKKTTEARKYVNFGCFEALIPFTGSQLHLY